MKTLKILSLAFLVVTATSNGFGGDIQDEEQGITPSQAYLGVGVEMLHPALTNHLPDVIGKGRGVMVEEVVTDSPADKAGLRQYDVLVRINDQELYSPEQLVKIIRNSRPGSQVALSYVRHGKIQDAKITLGETPMRDPVRSGYSFRLPFAERLDWPEAFRSIQPPLAPKSSWETFRSMSIAKQEDGTYQLELEYRGGNDKEIHREYTGTREEVKRAIQEDKELPKDERDHLLRSLDKQDGQQYTQFRLPWMEDWGRELFNWPNLDF